MDWPETSRQDPTKAKWALRTDSEAYLDALEAKLARTREPNLLPPPPLRLPPTTSFGLDRSLESGSMSSVSDVDGFGDSEEEDGGDDDDDVSLATAGMYDGGEGTERLDDDEGAVARREEVEAGTSLLWDHFQQQQQHLVHQQQQMLNDQQNPVASSSSSPSPLLSPVPKRSTSRTVRRVASSSSTSSTLSIPPSQSLSSSPSSSSHPRSRSTSPFNYRHHSGSGPFDFPSTIPESPLPSSPSLPPVPIPRSVRWNPRTRLRPIFPAGGTSHSSYGSFASDRSGSLVSTSPVVGTPHWRYLHSQPSQKSKKSGVKSHRTENWERHYGGAGTPGWVPGMKYDPQAAGMGGTLSSSSIGENTRLLGASPPTPKTEEDAAFGPGWARLSSWDWWVWMLDLCDDDWSWVSCFCDGDWDDDDWGDGGRSRRAGEGSGFF